jgi:3-oxoacyl-[acyl-carrier-protein] synthase II
LGTLTPLGVDPLTLFQRLLAGDCAIAPIQAFDTAAMPVRIAAEVSGFEAKTYITDKNQRRALKMMSRPLQFAVSAAALAMSGVDRSQIDSTRFGVEFGAGLIPSELPELGEAATLSANAEPASVDLAKWGREGIPAIQPLWMLKYLPNLPAGHISIFHDAQGPNNSITESDAASLIALGEAFRILGRDGADFFLTGGCESKINPVSLVRQCLFEKLSHHHDNPAAACRPYDLHRDGMVLGEGSTVLIAEELGHAQRRGATPLAEMIGFGAAFERDHTGKGLARAIHAALRDADLTPADIGFVIGHATGHPVHDPLEARGLAEVFGPQGVPVYAAKAALGHLGAASGATEVAIGVLALQQGVVPPTLNYTTVDPECPVQVITAPHRITKQAFLKVAYTSLGQCAAAIIKKWE